ncbi:MAG TPA: hypothetical protein VGM90_38655 [Kofleriaceae bacterium]|jgi:adenylyltransferase/sulfurtransferase
MRDEQVRRYARHILLHDVGGLGQTHLMVAATRVAVDGEPSASLVAATYLAAGGVGTIVVAGASDAQRAELAAHGPDTKIVETGDAKDLPIEGSPHWWPSAEGDATALAFWRGATAATRWMAAIANR